MKILILILATSISFFSLTKVFSQNSYIPDDNFEQALIDLGYDAGALNDSVPTANINALTSLNVSGKNISDFTGIEDFVALTDLNCGNNNLSSLDLSGNVALQELNCFNNQLTGIAIGLNSNLAEIVCYNNQLTILDVSSNPVLLKLNCSNNQLTSLDLSTNTSLTYVNCSNNELTSLNLKNGNNNNMTGGNYWETGIDSRNNPDLFCIQVDNATNAASYYTWYEDFWTEYHVDCSGFTLEKAYIPDDNFEQALISLGYDYGTPNDYVPVTSLKKVTSLNLGYKNISDLTGIEYFTALTTLKCHSNQLAACDLSNNINLTYIDCTYNQITQLEVSENSKLQTLYCYHNKLIDLDLSSNPQLTTLYCYYNQLTGLNVRNGNNSNLRLSAQYNPNLFCIQVDDVNAANNFSNWDKNIYTEYSENCSDYVPEMTYVPDDSFEQALINLGYDSGSLNDSVPTAAIKSIKNLNIAYGTIQDLSGVEDFTALEQLNCNNNQISIIDLSSNVNLKILNCYRNKITNLDLKSNSLLTTVNCYENNLVQLDISSNPLITALNARYNQLTGVNVRNGNNSNMSCDLRYNPDLLCIQVDNPAASYENTNWYKNVYAGYTEDCSTYVPEMTYVPDDKFEQRLISMGLDNGSLNDSVPTVALKSVSTLDVSFQSISDLTGIEDFENLQNLNCVYNNIENLNLSQNVKLSDLKCYYNKITTLDLRANSNLTSLNCQSNPLISLDIFENVNLEYLNCDYCQLTNLNLQNNDKLATFSAYRNPPLCILVNSIELAESKTQWYIDDWAHYSLDCSEHLAEKGYIPDDNFEEALISLGYDYGTPDDSVYNSIVATVTSLSLSSKNIQSLEGIELFTSLEQLNFSYNDISKVDLSHNLNLTELSCRENNLDSLNVSNNSKLISLDCNGNQISSIDLSSCLELQLLDCRKNTLQNLDISHNVKLTQITCLENYLTGLDPSSNTLLENISCAYNKLSSLDVSHNPALIFLSCNSNKLTKLNLSSNVLLKTIYCGYNQLTSLDLSNNSNLRDLNCENNKLTSLNLKNGNNDNLYNVYTQYNPELLCIQVDNSRISESSSRWHEDSQASYSEDCAYDFRKTYIPDDNFEQALIDLGYDSGELDDSVLTANIINVNNLEIPNKNISSLQGIEAFENLLWINCSKNKISELNLNNNKRVTSVTCINNQISELHVDSLHSLEFLECAENKLKNIDVSNNHILSYFNCANNQIASLNLTSNLDLANLICPFNLLTELDVRLNSRLVEFHCGDNQILSLDLSSNTKLTIVACYNNKLSELNLKNGNNFNMTGDGHELRAFGNPNLTCIQVDNAVAASSYSDWSKDSQARYSENCKDESTKGPGVPFSEYNALVDFYNNLDGDNWSVNDNWLDTINYSVSEWAGVVVENGHVTALNLDSVNANGVLPESLIQLSYLKDLNLFNNKISGSIPNWIGQLSNLRTFALAMNNLTGNIPTSVGNLKKLEILEISLNQIEGNIPEEIGNAESLKFLMMNHNKLSGAIPQNIGNLENLRIIQIENNELTGTIPSTIGNLSQLRGIDLSHNQLSGPIPPELGGLANLKLFKIDDNLFGDSDSEKSGKLLSDLSTADNRQIPDELAGLLQMDTLHLGGNNLQFNDIEAIFSWDNYDSFHEFVYIPQDSIGITKIETGKTGETITLSLTNYYPGPSDQYQWFKNNSVIQNATHATLELSDLNLADAGKYFCKITNPVADKLTLNSRTITIQVLENFENSNIPVSEYETLVEIYNITNGLLWNHNNNWLDTINYTVNDWYGITVENNHVTEFKMPNNNLSKIPEQLNKLTELKSIDLSDGDFEGDIPNFENLSKLDTLNLSGNKFVFKGLKEMSAWNNYDNFKTNFIYSPQAKVGEYERLYFLIGDISVH